MTVPPQRCQDGDTFERFTDEARRVLVLAQEEARLLAHEYIGTEHILLGVIRVEDGIAASTLRSFGVELDNIRDRLYTTVGTSTAPVSSPPFTPRAKKSLEYSLREALSLGHQTISPEHLLLGIINEGSGLAVEILVSLGVDVDDLRQDVIDQVSRPPSSGSSRPWRSQRLINVTGRHGPRWSPVPPACSFCGRDTWESDHFVSVGTTVICSTCIVDAGRALGAADPTEWQLFLPPRVFGTAPEPTALESITAAIRVAFGSESSAEELSRVIEDFDELQPFWVLAAERLPSDQRHIVLDRVRFLDDSHAAVQFRTAFAGGSNLHQVVLVCTDQDWQVTAASMREFIRGFGIPTPR